MSEKQREILETLEKVIPTLDEREQEKLLSFGQGMAFLKEQQMQSNKPKRKKNKGKQ